MAEVHAGAAAERSNRLTAFLAAQLIVPYYALVWRLLSGEVHMYGWGWQMYSFW